MRTQMATPAAMMEELQRAAFRALRQLEVFQRNRQVIETALGRMKNPGSLFLPLFDEIVERLKDALEASQ